MQNNQAKSTVKSSFIVFLVSLLTVIPIRTIQFFTILEPITGFYSKVDWSVYVLNTLLILFGVFFILLFVLGKKEVVYSTVKKKSSAMALASFMLALTLVIASLAEFKDAVLTFTDPSSAIYMGVFENLFRTGAGAKLLQAIAAAVSCVYFVLIGVDNLKGTDIAKSNKIIALFPVLWCIFKLMSRFMRMINFLNVSDLLYELFMCVFLMLFFMAFAQINSKVNNEGADYKLGAFGLTAAMLCLLCFVPRFIAMCAQGSAALAIDSSVEWCDLGCAVFIVTALLSRLKVKGSNEIEIDGEKIPAVTESEAKEGSDTSK